MLKIDRVLSDNFTGAYKLTRHLIDLGHRRIGIISVPQHSGSIARRVAGVNHALLEAGIQQEQHLFVEGALEQVSTRVLRRTTVPAKFKTPDCCDGTYRRDGRRHFARRLESRSLPSP